MPSYKSEMHRNQQKKAQANKAANRESKKPKITYRKEREN